MADVSPFTALAFLISAGVAFAAILSLGAYELYCILWLGERRDSL